MTIKYTISFFALAFGLLACNSDSNRINPNDYQAKVQSIEEIERSEPARFLIASGNYNQNFFGDKIKIHGIIENTATVATYKDVVIKVTYYSKTKTNLGEKVYTIYDFFPPHSSKTFELKIENYQDVNTIGWNVIRALPN